MPLTLTEKDIQEVKMLLEQATVNNAALKAASFDTIAKTLQNNHTLNRCIRDESGTIISFLACTESKNGTPGVVDLSYSFIGKGAISSIGDELLKLVKRAKKKGYNTLTIEVSNPIHRRYLLQQGWKESNKSDNGLYFNVAEGTKNITTSEKQKEKESIAQIQQQVKKDIIYLTNQAADIIKNINCAFLEKALIDVYLVGDDPQKNLLYGALGTVLTHEPFTLLEQFSIKEIFAQSKRIQEQLYRQNNAKEYATALIDYLVKQKGNENNNDTEHLHVIIEKFLHTNKKESRKKGLQKILTKHAIIIPKDLVLNDKFLFELKEIPPTHITTIIIDEQEFAIVSLETKNQCIQESTMLGHCIGNSDYYPDKIRKGIIKAFSLRDKEGKAHYTIEYEIATRTIKQFKGGHDQPVNSLPNAEEIVMKTFQGLQQSGFHVSHCDEDLDYGIAFDGENNEFIRVDDFINIDHYIDHKNIQIVKGIATVDQTTTKEQLDYVSTIPGVTIDMSNSTQEQKDWLVHVEGSIIDVTIKTGNAIYNNLQSIIGDFDIRGASCFSAVNLTTIGNNFYLDNDIPVSIDNVTSIGGSLNTCNAISLSAKKLTTVGRYINASFVESFSANSLISIHSDFIAKRAIYFSANSLVSVNGRMDVSNAKTVNINSLTSVNGDFLIYNAPTVNVSSLVSVAGDLDASEAVEFNANALEIVEGSLNVENVISFSANNLKSVGYYLIARKAKTFDAHALKSVNHIFDIRNAHTVSVENLEYVGDDFILSNVIEFTANKLDNVYGDLHLKNAQSVYLESLMKINGELVIGLAEKAFIFPELTTVNGDITIPKTAKEIVLSEKFFIERGMQMYITQNENEENYSFQEFIEHSQESGANITII